MTPAAIIREAAADGVSLALSPTGTIKAFGDQVAVNRWLPVLSEHKVTLLAALAHPSLPGVAEDLNDTAAADLKEFFEERAGILEHDAGLPRPDAEFEAARITTTYARNRGCLWVSLRAALASYPALGAQLPDRPGPIDSLPFGTARVHVREDAKPGPVSGGIYITEAKIDAARKGRTVVRQGDFTGAPEVKP